MDLIAVIGLEMHIEMKTKSKMFSSAPVSFGELPNTNVAPLDLALPGAMPVVNKQAVINAIRVCHALHMSIDNELWFERKNYFYSDLPKGYQITQENRPIGKNGYIELADKKINISSLHMEEDTCKQIHYSDYTLIDYNRCGIPLLEIVSSPELTSGEEAMRYVDKIRSIVTFLNVSDGKMEEGSLRVDVNISIKDRNSDSFGTKVEIKNINTLSNIKKAIDFEIDRQKNIISSGGNIIKETRRYDEKKGQTVPMRLKMDSIDYKFYVEANIIPIRLSEEFILNAINTSSETADSKFNRYQKLGLNEYDANLLTSNKETSDYFDEVILEGANPKLAANWINVEVQRILKKDKINIKGFVISPKTLASLIKLIEEGEISNKLAKDVFASLLKGDKDLNTILNELNIKVMNDDTEIIKIINDVLLENPNLVMDYKNGKDRVASYIVGKVMKATNGKANPGLTNKLVLKELQRRK